LPNFVVRFFSIKLSCYVATVAVGGISNGRKQLESVKIYLCTLDMPIQQQPNALSVCNRIPKFKKDIRIQACDIAYKDIAALDFITYRLDHHTAANRQAFPTNNINHGTFVQIINRLFDAFRTIFGRRWICHETPGLSKACTFA